jgi:integrase
VDALRAHRKAQLEERLSFGPDYLMTLVPFGDLVFREADGQPVNPVAFGKRFERAVTRLGLPKIPLHGLRHTWATLALAKNVHPKVVSGRLGLQHGLGERWIWLAEAEDELRVVGHPVRPNP